MSKLTVVVVSMSAALAAGVTFEKTTVKITDGSGALQSADLVDGEAVFTVPDGAGTGEVHDVASDGTTIGAPLTFVFNGTVNAPPATFPQSTSVTATVTAE